MNRNLYRIIFNRARAMPVVVGEAAAGHGGASARTRTRRAAIAWCGALLPLATVLTFPAHAQIVADSSAPTALQPHVHSAANGVPLVEINRPSAAGVSRNVYSRFDVDAQGAILNNARTNAATQLGGWVQGNPALGAGEARVILNEVNATDPSQLRGYIEVAGRRAEVVVANPSGIACDGCGFINANRATLTTGQPIIEDGRLEGYRVAGGTVAIEGAGLDASTTDYAQIIARAVEVNAGIWANDLEVTAGASAGAGGPAPAVGIDVAVLGGMYAGKITLVGTEAGVGVRNAGHIGATAGELVVTADGRLENSGTLVAHGTLQIDTRAGLTHSGTAYSGGHTHIDTEGDIDNRGVLAAGGDLVLTSAGSIASAADAVLAAGIDEAGHASGTGALSLQADATVAAHGTLVAGGDARLRAGTVDVSGSRTTARNVSLEADTGDIDLGGAQIEARATLTAQAHDALRSDDAVVLGQTVAITADTLSNRDGRIVADTHLDVDVGRITHAGELLSLDELTLRLGEDTALDGRVAAANTATIEAAGALNNHGELAAGATLTVAAAHLENAAEGVIRAAQVALTASGPNTLVNRGLIDGTDLRLDTPALHNLGTGRIYGDTLAIGTDTLVNAAEGAAAPVIGARTRLDIGAGTLTNRDGALIFSAGNMVIGGALDADGRAQARAAQLTNHNATIEALGALAIAADTLDNRNGGITLATLTDAAEHFDQFTPRGTSVVLDAADYPGAQIGNVHMRWRWAGDRRFREYWRYVFTATTTHDVVATSLPASILSGADMHLDGNVTNVDSTIVAGGALLVTGGTLENRNTEGRSVTRFSGTQYYYDYDGWMSCSSSRGCYKVSSSAYNRSPLTTTFALPTTQVSQHTVALATGTAVPVFVSEGVGDVAVRTGGFALGTPTSSLFATLAAPTGGYLVETDPRFADYRHWLSSDHLLAQLGLDPALIALRLGDGFYEQQLVREQIARLTGQRILPGHAEQEAQYRALLEAGASFAQDWSLVPGVALTGAQMAALTTDIVWLVEHTVTLADGSEQAVLVPQVYVRVRDGDLGPTGALIAADTVQLDLSADLANHGTIAGRSVVNLSAANIRNLGGRITSADTTIAALQDLSITGGRIEGVDGLAVSAGRDLTMESTTRSNDQAAWRDRLAGLYVTGANGVLVAHAGRDLQLTAAEIVNNGNNGQTILAAGRDLALDTVATHDALSAQAGKNWLDLSTRSEIGSTVATAGELALVAERDLSARAATLNSDTGTLTLAAGRDIALAAGEAETQMEALHKRSSSGFLSSRKSTTWYAEERTAALATTVSAEQVEVMAARDLSVAASNVVATGDVTLTGGRDLTVSAGEERLVRGYERKEKESGVFSGGGASITIGSRSLEQRQTSKSTFAAPATVGSLEGDVTLTAGQHYRQTGSDVLAPQGDIDIAAQRVDVVEARETHRSTQETKAKQSGLTVAVSSPVISAVQTAQQMKQAAKDTSDSRMQALAAASTALTAHEAYGAVKAGQGATVNGTPNQIAVLDENNNVTGYRDATAADRVGGINVSVSIGSSKSRSSATHTADTAAGSTVAAGGDVTITAAGAGADSDLTVRGSTLTAGRDLTLIAENAIELVAAANTAEQHSRNKSSSASIGVGFAVGGQQTGFTIQAGASQGKGRADGEDLAWTNTHVAAGETLTLRSGDDTTLRGAVASGERVVADVGGDLVIESLQDISTYESEQKSGGFGLSLCIPPFCYGATTTGNISASQSGIESTYASVTEQSALRADDGGFDVRVGGDTTLTGGAITSTDAAVEGGLNHFETGGELALADIQNRAEYEGKSVGVSIGTGVSTDGKLAPQGSSAGVGEDSDKAGTTTVAAISGIAGNTDARTGDAEAGLKPIFDADKVQREIDAQVVITQAFGQHASKAIGDYAKARLTEAKEKQIEGLLLQQQADIARSEGRSADADFLQAQADSALNTAEGLRNQWGESGSARLALHTLVGALTGGVEGATGAAIGTLATPHLARLVEQSGLPEPLQQILVLGAAATAGGAAGGTAGAASSFNEAANNYLTSVQALAYDKELAACANILCVAGATLKYEGISAMLDAGLLIGIGGGIGYQAIEQAEAIIDLVTHLPETLAALQAIVTDPEFRAKVGEAIANDYEQRIEMQTRAYNDGGWDGSVASGVEAGRLAVDIVGVATVALGTGKLAVVTAKAGASVATDGITTMASKMSQLGVSGFKNADELNALMKANEWAPAWKAGTQVAETTLPAGTRVKMVVDQKTWDDIGRGELDRAFGGWATFDDVPNQAYARNQLAITPEFKPNVGYLVEVEITQPIAAKVGIVGAQGSSSGGGNQLHFVLSPGDRTSVFKIVDGRALP